MRIRAQTSEKLAEREGLWCSDSSLYLEGLSTPSLSSTIGHTQFSGLFYRIKFSFWFGFLLIHAFSRLRSCPA
jgi:hypothetical protein